VLFIAGFFGSVRLLEDRLVFFPFKYPRGYWQPASFGLNAEDCFFAASDAVQLHGWWVTTPGARITLLWCHGNAGNISDRLDNLASLTKLPVNIFIFDYRGFGRSDGSPTEHGVYLDAEAAYDFLVREKNIAPGEMVLFGRSLGGAVAVELATRRPCQKLILESTFTSARDMAKQMFGLLPVSWATSYRLDSDRKTSRR